MNSENVQFISEISIGAKQFLPLENEQDLFENAVHGWAVANKQTGAPHPSLDGLRDFLQQVVQSVVKDLTTKYSDVTAITLGLVTETLLSHLAYKYGWTGTLTPYSVPLKILTALIYKKILKHLGKLAKN